MGTTTMVRRGLVAPLMALLLLVGTVGAVSAQTATSAPTTGGTFTGKITKTSPLTVNSNGQDRQVNLAPNATVIRDGKAATAADLKVGDQVNVTSNPDNSVARVETTSAATGGSNILKWLIPLLIALLLLALVLALLSRRRKSDFVLERDNTGTRPNTRV